MYIKKVIIKNFRVFNEKGIEIVFSKGPNTIIGPNNSGKSAIIDALRIAFSACDYHKDIYFKLEDFHFNKMGIRANEAYIGLVLDEVDDTLMEIIDPEKERIGYINYKFYSEISKSGIEKVKYKVWGGNVETNVLTTELFENNFFVSYLNALRDVDNEFKPSKASKISNLIKRIYNDKNEEKQNLIENVKTLNSSLINDKNIVSARKIINNNIKEIEGNVFNQNIMFEFVEPKFDNIIASIKGSLPVDVIIIPDALLVEVKKCDKIDRFIFVKDGVSYLYIQKAFKNKCFEKNEDLYEELMKNCFSQDLSTNGLGYNNIIYIASVLGDIENIKKDDLTSILLIEEPEAHLHPQLQLLLQNYLNRTAKDNIQVIYTTHSPSIASNCRLNAINFIGNGDTNPSAVNVEDLRIHKEKTEDDYNQYLKDCAYLESFLDVTKSQMLFAKGVIFVEGVTESILISKFSELLGKSLADNQIEIVNINGVSFKPIANLITLKDGGCFLPSVIITDDDRCTNKDDINTYIDDTIDYDCNNIESVITKLKNGNESSRCKTLDTCFKETSVSIFKSYKTLEYELACSNCEICLEILKEQHSIIYNKLINLANENKENVTQIATRIWLVFKNRPEFKADFSRKFFDNLCDSNKKINVPKYIVDAIDKIVWMVQNGIK